MSRCGPECVIGRSHEQRRAEPRGGAGEGARASVDRARGAARRDRRGDPLPRGPRRRLARPLRAGHGARGHLRDRASPRRRRRRSRPSARRSTSSPERLGAAPSCQAVVPRGIRRLGSARPAAGRGSGTARGADRGAARRPAAQALTHSSWADHRADSYGRLAFLGDSVLGLAVAEHLFRRFPRADIGRLTKIHGQAVSGRACAEVAEALGLPEMLARGRARRPGGRHRPPTRCSPASARSPRSARR